MRRTSETLCTDSMWIGKADCSDCAVKSRLLFSSIDVGYLSQILRPIDNIVFEPNATLFRKDEAGAFVYSIRSGLLKLVRPLDSGGERIVRLQGKTDAIGLEAWLDRPYQNTAIALERLDVCRIPISVLKSIDQDQPQLSRQLEKQWEAALEKADFWIANLSTGPMRLRVAWLIHFLLECSDCGETGLRLLHSEDMADILGASKETVCRLMSELKHARILTRIAPRTYKCDLGALDDYAKPG